MSEMRSFEDFWETIDPYKACDLGKNFKKYVPQLSQGFMLDLMKQEEVDIGHSFHGQAHWAVILYDFYDSDKELSFRLNHDNRLSLYFRYWDDEGLSQEVDYFLNEEEMKILPSGLMPLMQEVLRRKESMTASNKHIQHGTTL
jgi:hypothetical protein